MGFRTGNWASVWEATPVNETRTKLRLSISRKNKQTGEYEQEFGGFVDVYGAEAAAQAAELTKGDRIKIGDVDVTTRYDAEKKVEYVNYKMFSFEMGDDDRSANPAKAAKSSKPTGMAKNRKPVRYEDEEDSDLPF